MMLKDRARSVRHGESKRSRSSGTFDVSCMPSSVVQWWCCARFGAMRLNSRHIDVGIHEGECVSILIIIDASSVSGVLSNLHRSRDYFEVFQLQTFRSNQIGNRSRLIKVLSQSKNTMMDMMSQ